MFQKLNISCIDLDINRLKGNMSMQYPTFTEFSILDKDYLFHTLSKQIKFNIIPNANISEVIYPGANPHTDKWPTSINFYLETTGEETSFWKEIKSSLDDSLQTIDLSTGPRSYKDCPLQKISSFIANTGDCYLMDVWSIHSVKITVPNFTRKILRLYWTDTLFDDVLKSIEIIKDTTD